MIILDIETSGLKPEKNGVLSIGAICFESPESIFYGECCLDPEDEISDDVLRINGFSREEITDKNKQSQKILIERFFNWIDLQKDRLFAGHNVGSFDMHFLKTKAEKYGIELKTRYRTFDLCTAAQVRYFQIHEKFFLDDFRENAMNLANVLEFCGIPDERIRIEQSRGVTKEGKTHNALEDCKLTAECFSRLLKGKILFPEYSKFPVPDYLKNDNL